MSELGAGLFEEARRRSEFAEIEFRTFQGERQACLTGGLRLWKLVMVAQDYVMDVEKTAFAIADLTRGVATQRLLGTSKTALEDDVDFVVDLIWKGIAR